MIETPTVYYVNSHWVLVMGALKVAGPAESLENAAWRFLFWLGRVSHKCGLVRPESSTWDLRARLERVRMMDVQHLRLTGYDHDEAAEAHILNAPLREDVLDWLENPRRNIKLTRGDLSNATEQQPAACEDIDI